MTISDLLCQYDFHDSILNNFTYCENDRSLQLHITLCNWRQIGYTPEDSELIPIHLVFDEVVYISIESDDNDFHRGSIVIAKEEVYNNGLKGIEFIVDWVNGVDLLFISTNSVQYVKD